MITRTISAAFLLAAFCVPLVAAEARGQTADHLKCYRIKDPLKLKGIVDLSSPQFGIEAGCKISRARLFCTPVTKTVTSARNGTDPISLLAVSGPNPGDRICYPVRCPTAAAPGGQVSDQFGTRAITVSKAEMLCVPAVQGPPGPVNPTGMCYDPTGGQPIILDCNTGAGYEVDSKLGPPPAPGATALRVLGVNGTPGGVANVIVNRRERLVLVLSAYEATHWNVTAAPGAVLERVILNGGYAQTATVPPGVPVENHSPDFGLIGDCGFDMPYEGGGCDTNVMLAGAEQVTGLCLTSFHGCYEASTFVIPASPSGAFLDGVQDW